MRFGFNVDSKNTKNARQVHYKQRKFIDEL